MVEAADKMKTPINIASKIDIGGFREGVGDVGVELGVVARREQDAAVHGRSLLIMIRNAGNQTT
jgi:hypothetical protein